MARIELSGIRKTYEIEDSLSGPGSMNYVQRAHFGIGNVLAAGKALALDGVDLEIPDGKVMAILGPSGCGKSSLLRIVAGLEEADEGTVKFDGEEVDLKSLPADRRGIGMVFQDYALYPNMKAKRNILSAFAFRERKPELDEAAMEKFRKTGELLGVEMSYLLDRSPRQLSGGERQRVAIGRCITRDPKLFLMDEPFSSLDAKLRETYRSQLKRLLSLYRVTTVYVTHDQREAQVLADLVAVMRKGKIVQVGSYLELYESPADDFVAGFVNLDSELPPIAFFGEGFLEEGYGGRRLGVRPEDWTMLPSREPGCLDCVLVQARRSPFRDEAVYTVKAGAEGTAFQFKGPLREGLEPGAPIWLSPRKIHVFDAASGLRLETKVIS